MDVTDEETTVCSVYDVMPALASRAGGEVAAPLPE